MLPLIRCPNCRQRSLRWWRVSSSSAAQPALCRECRALVYQSTLGSWLSGVGLYLAFFGGLIAAAALESFWGLLLIPLGFIAAVACGLALPLRDSEASESQAAQQRAQRIGRLALWATAGLCLYLLTRAIWPDW